LFACEVKKGGMELEGVKIIHPLNAKNKNEKNKYQN
jgi:hypothetical protein